VSVELLDPVTDDLNRNTAPCGRRTVAGDIMDRGNRQELPRLRGVQGMAGREAARLCIRFRSILQGVLGVVRSLQPWVSSPVT